MSSLKLIHAASTRANGNMSFRYGDQETVRRNRETFLTKYDIALKQCVTMRLDHGTGCAIVTNADIGRGMTGRDSISADCLITNLPDTFLFLLTGDCLPVALYDRHHSVIALAHLSRKNADRHFIEKIIELLIYQYHAHASELHVYIGPGIHKKSYVKQATIEEASQPVWQPFIQRIPKGIKLDLPGLVLHELLQMGLTKQNINMSPIDTAASPDYFSHYRGSRTNEHEGRIATVLGMRAA